MNEGAERMPHSQHPTQLRQQVCIPDITATEIGKASTFAAAEASAAPQYTRKTSVANPQQAASTCTDLKPDLLSWTILFCKALSKDLASFAALVACMAALQQTI
jgi:hypothetical protein